MKRHDFRQLRVWQLAMDVIDGIYQITRGFPKEEQYGLTSQMIKSAISIASNLAEGCGRGTNPQLLHFCDISQGSAFELETQAYIALRQNFCSAGILNPTITKIIDVQKMIDGFQARYR